MRDSPFIEDVNEMKKLIPCLISALCLSLLCLVLVACGPDYKPNFVGTWRVTAMTDSSGAELTSTIEQLASAEKYLTLTLSDEDDQASFDLANQTTLSGTWKPTGEDTCVIDFEGYEEIPATLSDGALTFEEGGQTMTCTKQE